MKLMNPMEPILADEIIRGKQYIHQIKWDGIRIMSYITRDKLELYTKRGTQRTIQYPEIKQLLELDHVDSAVFDGEAICIKNGKPSFREIVIRNRTMKEIAIHELMKKHPVYYVIFDILELNGKDLRDHPFHERDRILRKLIMSSDRIKLVDNSQEGDELYGVVKENALEGIVSKDINSSYIPGKDHKAWFKYKLSRKILCAVCGIHLNSDKRPKSIILGVNDGGKLILVGAASSGLTQRDIGLLNQNLEMLKINYNPITKEKAIDSNIVWFDPILTCWISFMEWTEDGIMRHPKIMGFSNQKMEEADGTEYIK